MSRGGKVGNLRRTEQILSSSLHEDQRVRIVVDVGEVFVGTRVGRV